MLSIYAVGLALFGLGYLLLRKLRGRPTPGLKERLAFYPRPLREALDRLNRPIWIHLVSVGEVLAARPLIEELRRRYPGKGWVITTVTETGRSLAQELLRGPQDRLLYLPWDFGPVVRRAVGRIRPSLFLVFETELWPALFDELARREVPIAVLNGRISPAAYKRYLWVRRWMEGVLSCVALFFTQSPQDARRYAGIGAAKDRIVVTGNLKWDLKPPASSSNGAGPARVPGLLWTAGSTHPGEEKILMDVYRRLKSRFPGLRLLIAPRHPERVPEVEREAAAQGLATVRKSKRTGAETGDPVILLDTLGELASFYEISDVVFVGGSLVPHGGHNLVEPAVLGRPILSGPHLHNFQAISDALLQAKGMTVVPSGEELERALVRFLENPAMGREMGERARAVIDQHRGAAARTAELIALRWGPLLCS